MSWREMTEEDYATQDKDCAFSEGWRSGERGQPLTEDDLIPWPQRLRLAFKTGFEGGLKWHKEHRHDL